LVPLRFLIEGLHLTTENDRGVVVLRGDKCLTKGKFTYFADDDRFGLARTLDPLAVRPINFR